MVLLRLALDVDLLPMWFMAGGGNQTKYGIIIGQHCENLRMKRQLRKDRPIQTSSSNLNLNQRIKS